MLTRNAERISGSVCHLDAMLSRALAVPDGEEGAGHQGRFVVSRVSAAADKSIGSRRREGSTVVARATNSRGFWGEFEERKRKKCPSQKRAPGFPRCQSRTSSRMRDRERGGPGGRNDFKEEVEHSSKKRILFLTKQTYRSHSKQRADMDEVEKQTYRLLQNRATDG